MQSHNSEKWFMRNTCKEHGWRTFTMIEYEESQMVKNFHIEQKGQ